MVRLATHSIFLLLTTSCNTCLFTLTSRSICCINLDIPQYVFITLKSTGCVFISHNILEHMLHWKKPHCGAYPPLYWCTFHLIWYHIATTLLCISTTILVHISSHLMPHHIHNYIVLCLVYYRLTGHKTPTYLSGVCSQHCNTARSCDAVDVIVFHLMIEGSGLPVTQLCEPNRVSQYLANKKIITETTILEQNEAQSARAESTNKGVN